MTTRLLSYAEAAAQVSLFVHGLAQDRAARGEAAARETVGLAAAAGRVLAQPVEADRDQPPFARSTRDGFACRAAEAGSHRPLVVAGQLRAGQVPRGLLGGGEAWEIMTGAPLPEGADAVMMVEHVERSSSRTETAGQEPSERDLVRLAEPRTLQAGENVVARGAEARAGDLLLAPGTRLGPAQIALAAQCGYARLAVARRPRVAILATGDELVAVEATPGPGQIRNSNAPMLAALVTAAGGIPLVLEAAADRPDALDGALARALDAVPAGALGAELLLVSGGISAGRFDLVDEALERLGAQFLFRGVAIQPGKPVAFGQLPRPDGRGLLDGRVLPFLALPGNPISSAVTFHLFAAPLLAALGQDEAAWPRFAAAQLDGAWRGKAGLTRFLPAHCDFRLTPRVKALPWQGSGDVAAYARSNCLLVVAAETEALADRSTVAILLP
jgi:molybdopterin molybdotransferase